MSRWCERADDCAVNHAAEDSRGVLESVRRGRVEISFALKETSRCRRVRGCRPRTRHGCAWRILRKSAPMFGRPAVWFCEAAFAFHFRARGQKIIPCPLAESFSRLNRCFILQIQKSRFKTRRTLRIKVAELNAMVHNPSFTSALVKMLSSRRLIR